MSTVQIWTLVFVVITSLVSGQSTIGSGASLNDLARRVDLRLVGKRPLECLIMVGALDQFGQRQAMRNEEPRDITDE